MPRRRVLRLRMLTLGNCPSHQLEVLRQQQRVSLVEIKAPPPQQQQQAADQRTRKWGRCRCTSRNECSTRRPPPPCRSRLSPRSLASLWRHLAGPSPSTRTTRRRSRRRPRRQPRSASSSARAEPWRCKTSCKWRRRRRRIRRVDHRLQSAGRPLQPVVRFKSSTGNRLLRWLLTGRINAAGNRSRNDLWYHRRRSDLP